MSGSTPVCWIPSHFPGPAHPGLDLVDDHQGARVVAEVADPPEELVGRA